MKLAVLVLVAAQLPAATILPGSWIDLPYSDGYGTAYSLTTTDGFHIEGGFYPYGVGSVGVILENGYHETSWASIHTDMYVTAVSAPWLPGAGFDADGDGVGLIVDGPTCLPTPVCGSFTFYGYLDAGGAANGSPVWPAFLELHGQGTAYLSFETIGNDTWLTGARYEFESITHAPEPGTWGLLLLGLGAYWARRRDIT